MRTEAEVRVKDLGRAFRSVVLVADALEKIKSLEQATHEAKKASDEAFVVRCDEEAKLVKMKEALASVETDVMSAQQKAKRILIEAETQAEEIVSDAGSKAVGVVADAEIEAAALRETIHRDREAHTLYMEDVGHQHEEAQVALDTINIDLKMLREKFGP